MNTKKLKLFFTLLVVLVICILSGFFYLFTKEKDLAQDTTIKTYRENSLKLISDNIYEDLIIDNLLEAQRKLNILQENKIIKKYSILKDNDVDKDHPYLCSKVYFDRILKNAYWGKVCLDFHETPQEKTLVNLDSLSVLVTLLMLFTITLILLLIKKVSQMNSELYIGIENVLKSNNCIISKGSFWAPVLIQLEKLVDSNKISEKKLHEQQVENEKIELANQVAHDIRSPLSVLNKLKLLSSNERLNTQLASEAIERLNSISDMLLSKGRSKPSEILELIDPRNSIRKIIEMEEVEFNNFEIIHHIDNSKCFLLMNETNFESILSNLLNNAIEASVFNSLIAVTAKISENSYFISIKDSGKGIPPAILNKLGKEKISYEKFNGNGLGFYNAFQLVNSWGGSMQIYSEINKGTSVEIKIPIEKVFSEDDYVILVENDDLVSLTWEFRARKAGYKFLNFRKSEEVLPILTTLDKETIFFIDSELEQEKGEDLAKTLFENNFRNLYICTGHDKVKFEHLSFIKRIVGKSPPF